MPLHDFIALIAHVSRTEESSLSTPRASALALTFRTSIDRCLLQIRTFPGAWFMSVPCNQSDAQVPSRSRPDDSSAPGDRDEG